MKIFGGLLLATVSVSGLTRKQRLEKRDRLNIRNELQEKMSFEGWERKDWHENLDHLVKSFYEDNPHLKERYPEFEEEDFTAEDEDIVLGGRTGLMGRTQLNDEDKAHMMKYLQLKYSILFLQKQKFIGKYCFYGCWCLPTGSKDLGAGYGPPIDDIDKSCREYTTCYNCLYSQDLLGQRCNEASVGKYNIQGTQDPTTGQVTLFCMDPQGSCLRSRCECDKALAEKLSTHEMDWNMQYHHKWGTPPFDREANCKAANIEQQMAVPPPSSQFSGYQSDQQKLSYTAQPSNGYAQTSYTSNGQTSNTYGAPASSQAGQPAQPAQVIQVIRPAANGHQKLANILESIKQTHSEQTGDGTLVLQLNKGSGAARPQQVTVVQNSAPIYGAIIGCCGRAPDVKYYRSGQRCCADGEIVDAQAPCSMDFM